MQKKIVYISEVLYIYRISRDGSITTNLNNEHNFDCIKVSERIFDYVITNNKVHFLPQVIAFVLRLNVLGYLRINKSCEKEYFEQMCKFVDKYSLNLKTKVAFVKNLYNRLCFKAVIHKNKFCLDLLIKTRFYIKCLYKKILLK